MPVNASKRALLIDRFPNARNSLRIMLASCVPCLLVIGLLPLLLYRLFPPGITATPEAPERARQELRTMGPMSRHEWITAAR